MDGKLAFIEEMARRRFLALTPEQRIKECHRLNQATFAALEADPEAFDSWYRRNLRRRAVDPQPIFARISELGKQDASGAIGTP